MEDGLRRREDVGPQLQMDAVGADDDVGFGGGTVRESHARDFTDLVEADGAMAAVHHAGGEGCGKKID